MLCESWRVSDCVHRWPPWYSLMCTSVSGTVTDRKVQIAAAVLNFLTGCTSTGNEKDFFFKIRYKSNLLILSSDFNAAFLLSAGSMLIGVSIYGGKYKYETEIENYNIFWSFIVSIIAGVSYLTSGFVYLFIDSGNVFLFFLLLFNEFETLAIINICIHNFPIMYSKLAVVSSKSKHVLSLQVKLNSEKLNMYKEETPHWHFVRTAHICLSIGPL